MNKPEPQRLLQIIIIMVFVPALIWINMKADEIDAMMAKPLHVHPLRNGKYIVMEHGHFRSAVYDTEEEANSKLDEIKEGK